MRMRKLKKRTGRSKRMMGKLKVSLNFLSANGAEIDMPTLDEYLSKLVCSGCGNHCQLTGLRCDRGTQYKNGVVAEYQETYRQSIPHTRGNSNIRK